MSKKNARTGPKSTKADGTPKKRWTAAERAARGHSPRRSGGLPRTRGTEDDRRDQRSGATRSPREERPSREVRSTGKRWEKDNRSESDGRSRENRFGDTRPRRDDRPRREDRFGRDDRPRREDRFGRDDRPRREDRFGRDDRPRREDRFGRDDRPRREDRFGRDDRPRREDRFGRDDRRRRDDRPRRDAHKGHAARGDRPFPSHRGGEKAVRHDRFRPERELMDRSSSDRDDMSWTPAEAPVAEKPVADKPVADNPLAESPAAASLTVEGGFAGLGLRSELVSALSAQGIVDPFPIQAATIPDALSGRDVLGRGQTGSGKTLGFGLPLIDRLAADPDRRSGRTPRAVVLVPTRELAMQVADVVSPLGAGLGLFTMLVAGGMAYGPQIKAFQRGVDIVVATPGRLIDLMDQGAVDLSEVQIAVLDEADHMADLGFLPDVRRILDAVPTGGQRLLFSATLDRGVDTVVREYLADPVTHEVDPETAAVTTMEHHLLHIGPADKQTLTAEIANRPGRTVAFVRTQRGADRVADQLREAGVMAGALHGGLTQGARSRILGAFKEGSMPVLVATDVAARGIHVDEVGLVLQIDPPAGAKDYLHRAGRTARAGGQGTVVTLVLPHQRREMTRLIQRAGVEATPYVARPDDEHVYRATGARKPSRPAVAEEEYQAIVAPPKPARRSRGQGPRGRFSPGKGSGPHGKGRGAGRGRRS